MLFSNDIWLKVQPKAEINFGCAGNGELQMVRQFSPLCERRISKGDEYVEQLAILATQRRVPRIVYVQSRHCVHCALAFFPAIGVKEEHAA